MTIYKLYPIKYNNYNAYNSTVLNILRVLSTMDRPGRRRAEDSTVRIEALIAYTNIPLYRYTVMHKFIKSAPDHAGRASGVVVFCREPLGSGGLVEYRVDGVD